MPTCLRCRRPLPEPPEDSDAVDWGDVLGGDLRPGLSEILGAKVIRLDEAAGARRIAALLCPGCGRLPEDD